MESIQYRIIFFRELVREYEAARKVPLFSRQRALPEYVNYPYVFDSSVKVRHSASSIAGNKVYIYCYIVIVPFFVFPITYLFVRIRNPHIL